MQHAIVLAHELGADLQGPRLGNRRDGALGPGPPVSDARPLKIGAEFVREHDGVLHRVRVVEGGYAWSGTTYRSLSEAARAITGTRWNGPRFFGLRDRPARGDEA